VTTIERMQCGALAGLVAQTVTYPIEVTRRRMQTIGLVGNETALSSLGCASQRTLSPAPAATATSAPLSLLSTVKHLYTEQGHRGFMKGVSLNWMKGPVAFSISFTAFDTVQKWIESPAERAMRLPRRHVPSSSSA
jgi:solute carrier family 25, member 42